MSANNSLWALLANKLTSRRRPAKKVQYSSRRRVALAVEALEDRFLLASAIGVNFTGNMGGNAGGPQLRWPDSDGCAGPSDYVEFTNGAYTVFDKAGVTRLTETDATFWNNAGISRALTEFGSIYNTRILFDPLSNTWFATELSATTSTGNQILVGRSNTADPTDGWKAINFTGDVGFSDYPTLGVDANALYIGLNDFTNSFGSFLATSVCSIPKADMLANTPSAANRSVTRSTSAANGFTIQGVTNFSNSGPTNGVLVGTDLNSFGLVEKTNVTGTGGPGATFGPPTRIAIANTSDPGFARQPAPSRNIQALDDRITSTVYQVGDLIFLVHGISVNSSGVATFSSTSTTDAARITVLRDSTNAVVTEATYFNPNFDYIFPSLAINSNGNMLLGFTRSSANQGSGPTDGNLGCYAVEAKIDMANPSAGITFVGPDIQLKAGVVNNFNLLSFSPKEWGHYSMTNVDPTDPGTFWTVQEYAIASNEWGTQVSQIGIAPSVKSITSTTAAGTYDQGQTINVTVNFDLPVKVTGTPTISLNSGGTASYVSGDGTTSLIFSYTTASGDTTGFSNLNVTSASALSGTITNLSVAAAAADLTLPTSGPTALSSAKIKINAAAPVVLSYSVLFGSQSYDLIGSSRMDLPWSITGIRVIFSKPITAGDIFSLSGLSATGFSGLGTNTLTWTFGAISLGNFATALSGSDGHALTDAYGNALAAGAGFAQNFKVLQGDVNDDGVVNSADMVRVNLAQYQVYIAFFDINGDGVVDSNDVLMVRKRIGAHL